LMAVEKRLLALIPWFSVRSASSSLLN